MTYLPVAAILAVGLMAAARIVGLRRRGIQAVVNDPQRSLAEKIFEASTMFLLIFWVYMVIAYADARGPRWLPEWLDRQIFDNRLISWIGACFLALGVVLYGVALRHMGASWRMGIDRPAHDPHKAGPAAALVTDGIFARTRNPIYFSFDLLFLGSLLIHPRLIFLLTTAALAITLHIQILREERFLASVYGDHFAAYRQRTRRYT